MPKYFVEPGAVRGEKAQLEGETAHHLKRVLRIKAGESVILCDGNGMDYNCVVESIEPLVLSVDSRRECKTELPSRITLYQAMLKSDKMEWIIQKSVEIGVYEIVPVYTEHSVIKPKNDKDNKTVRYQKIAESAAGQSMRGIVPIVHKPMEWKEALEHAAGRFMLAAHEKEYETKLQDFRAKLPELPEELGLWIGPEGGFSKKEVLEMEKAGFSPVSLGPRILRAETAAIAALSQIAGMLEI